MQITVISLLQPWAQLVVIGAKKIETRSWDTPYRGVLYIHASKGKKYGDISCRELCYEEPFRSIICSGPGYDKLPFGAIIGKVNLFGTFPFGMPATEFQISINGGMYLDGRKIEFTKQEVAFGDFSAGRFGWLFSDPVLFDEPIPASGKQGFWNYEI